MADADQSNLTMLTVDLLSAYVANNTIEHNAIPDLIRSTHAALKSIDSDEAAAPEEPEHKPAVTVRKSLASDAHIISLIDGKPYQTLKRHLSRHGLTPEQYRERFGLPKSYPMVSKTYSDSRRAIAEKLGLGRRVKGTQAQAAAQAPTLAADTAPSDAPVPAKPVKTPITKAPKAAAKTKAVPAAPAKTKAPARAKAAAKVEAAADAPAAPAKVAPKARKASAPKPTPVPADAAAKPAPRRRTTKAAAATS